MSYQLPWNTVTQNAVGRLAPAGIAAEHAAKRLSGLVMTELGRMDFAEKASKPGKSGSYNRLKINTKAKEAVYATRMAGSTEGIKARALETYDWLCDVYDFVRDTNSQNVVVDPPNHIADFIKAGLAEMKPAPTTPANKPEPEPVPASEPVSA